MKKILSLILIALSLAFISCKHILTEPTELLQQQTETVVNTELGKLTISATSGYEAARSAIPTALPNGVVYFGKLSFDDSFIKNTGADKNLVFVFNGNSSAQESATLTVYACVSGTNSLTSASDSAIIALGTSNTVSLEANQLAADFGEISLKLNSGNSGNGTVSLSIENSSGGTLSIGSVTKDGTSVTASDYFTYPDSNGKLISVNDGIAAGTYTITFTAADSSGSSIDFENPVQVINVFAGMTTDKWIVDGEVCDKITISKATYTTFYVCGTDTSWYGTSITNYTAAADSNSGSMLKPLKTLGAAVSKCTDTSKTYTIYVDGTTNESSGSSIAASTKVTIKSLSSSGATIQRATGNTGSMITIGRGATVSIENITIEANSNASISNDGAAINNSGTLTLSGSTIQHGNTTGNGGGIFNSGTLTLTEGSKVIYCSASGNGGGIYIDSSSTSSTTIEGGSIIAGNSTSSNGGGIYQDGPLSLGNCYIGSNTYLYNRENETLGSDKTASSDCYSNYAGNVASGGGIYVNNFTAFTVSGTANISYNYATKGGGIACAGGYDPDSAQTADLHLNITYNCADNGGGLYVSGSQTYYTFGSNVNVSNNTASFNGGGVNTNGGIITFTGASIKNNKSNSTNGGGGGIYLSGGETVNITGGTEISGNTANKNGGGIYQQSTSAALNLGNCYIGTTTGTDYSNHAQYGGGIYISEGQRFNITENTQPVIRSNYAEASGGGIYIAASSESKALSGTSGKNVIVSYNLAGASGGGICVADGSFTLSYFTIDNNIVSGSTSASNGAGGGIYIYSSSSSTFTISDGEINSNTAKQGGGIYGSSSTMTFTISDTEVQQNNATDTAGGLLISGDTVEITDGTSNIQNNKIDGESNKDYADKVYKGTTSLTINESSDYGNIYYYPHSE